MIFSLPVQGRTLGVSRSNRPWDASTSTTSKDYDQAADALTKATELAKEEKRTLARREDKLDTIQEQLLSETYLFLARSYTELNRFDEALAACDEGMEQVSEYNLLRVQKRIVNKRLSDAATADP